MNATGVFAVTTGEVENLTYFATDGSYGDASGLTVVDTTGWDTTYFEVFDYVRDDSRADVARLICELKEAYAGLGSSALESTLLRELRRHHVPEELIGALLQKMSGGGVQEQNWTDVSDDAEEWAAVTEPIVITTLQRNNL